MFRFLLGLVKGAVLGGAVGYGAYRLGLHGGWNWITYAAVGFVVGMLVGRPFWSHLFDKTSTIWTAMLKAIFGAGISIGIYALVHRVLVDPSISILDESRQLTDWTFIFGALVGGLFGAWAEVDDAPAKDKPAEKKPST